MIAAAGQAGPALSIQKNLSASRKPFRFMKVRRLSGPRGARFLAPHTTHAPTAGGVAAAAAHLAARADDAAGRDGEGAA